jgi:hypothetical protein
MGKEIISIERVVQSICWIRGQKVLEKAPRYRAHKRV